jgi:hypothetical protein
MSIRYTENNVNQARGLVQLDADGKLPAVDCSQLTSLTAQASNGANFKTTTQSVNTFDAQAGQWYHLYEADDEYINSATYAITMPSQNIYSGSKVVFSTIIRGKYSGGTVPYLQQLPDVQQVINSQEWTLTVPSSSGTSYASFKMVIKGVTYNEGDTWTNTGGEIREMHFYAYVDASNNVVWHHFKFGLNRIGDIVGFRGASTIPSAPAAYKLTASTYTGECTPHRDWGHLEITGNTTLAWGTNLDTRYRSYLITVNAAAIPTITLPSSGSQGLLLVFKVMPNFKNTTLSSVAGRTKTTGFTIVPPAGGNLLVNKTSTTTSSTTFATMTAPTSTYSDATNQFSSSLWYAYATTTTSLNWYLMKARTNVAPY